MSRRKTAFGQKMAEVSLLRLSAPTSYFRDKLTRNPVRISNLSKMLMAFPVHRPVETVVGHQETLSLRSELLCAQSTLSPSQRGHHQIIKQLQTYTMAGNDLGMRVQGIGRRLQSLQIRVRGKPKPSPYRRYIRKRSKSSRAPEGNEKDPNANVRNKQTNLIHEKRWKTCLLSRVKALKIPVGLFSTELKAYKVRGGKTTGGRRKGGEN
jgi:hypothetical protein